MGWNMYNEGMNIEHELRITENKLQSYKINKWNKIRYDKMENNIE